MARARRTLLAWLVLTTMVPIAAHAQAQAPAQRPQPLTVAAEGRTFTVTARVPHDHLSLRVAAPDGRVFQLEGSGGVVRFEPFGISGTTAPEGSYTWEVRMTPRGAIPPELAARARRGRESGDAEAEAAMRVALSKAVVVQSGGFRILAGKLIAGQGSEREPARRRDVRGPNPQQPDAVRLAAARSVVGARVLDQVIPDDLIVQGSACIGLDCVNNESFGFDTIRLRENNLRIKFDDTSTISGYPANDWQITANDSPSGGLSKFSIDDISGGRTPMTIEAGTPSNSVYVDSTGRVGFRTGTPVLDIHLNSPDTPSIRMEQNSSGGFSAQTWDVAGNEANWFVRDVTGGSRLPLRIRPGAPTSSIDMAANGRIGMGTASPQTKLHVFGTATVDAVAGFGPNPSGAASDQPALNVGHGGASIGRGAGFFNVRPDSLAVAPNPSLRFMTANQERMIITNTGNVGLGLSNPAHPIHAVSGAHLTAGGVWTNASSRDLKADIRALTVDEARATLAGLNPIRFVYRTAPAERHAGFIAEDVPELVATADRKGLSPMDIVAVLTRVVQEQQARIDELAEKVAALEAANPSNRRIR